MTTLTTEQLMTLGEEARGRLSVLLDPECEGKHTHTWSSIEASVKMYVDSRKQLSALLAETPEQIKSMNFFEIARRVDELLRERAKATSDRVKADTEQLLDNEARRKLCSILTERPNDDSLSWCEIQDAVTSLLQSQRTSTQGLVDLEAILEIESPSSWHTILRHVREVVGELRGLHEMQEDVKKTRHRLSDIIQGESSSEYLSWHQIDSQLRKFVAERDLLVERIRILAEERDELAMRAYSLEEKEHEPASSNHQPTVKQVPLAPATGCKKAALVRDFEICINRRSAENGSDTPDFLLADFLAACLEALDETVVRREKWYGRECGGGAALRENEAQRPTKEELDRLQATISKQRLMLDDASRAQVLISEAFRQEGGLSWKALSEQVWGLAREHERLQDRIDPLEKHLEASCIALGLPTVAIEALVPAIQTLRENRDALAKKLEECQVPVFSNKRRYELAQALACDDLTSWDKLLCEVKRLREGATLADAEHGPRCLCSECLDRKHRQGAPDGKETTFPGIGVIFACSRCGNLVKTKQPGDLCKRCLEEAR